MKALIRTVRSLFDEMNFKFHNFFALVGASFMLSTMIFLLGENDYNNIWFIDSVDPVVFAVVGVAFFSIVFVITMFLRNTKVISYSLFVMTTLLSFFLCVDSGPNVYINFGVALCVFVVMRYLFKDEKLKIGTVSVSYKKAYVCVVVIFLAFSSIISYITTLKYLSFSHATFDFGIFAQMFDYMKDTGLPLTSIERGELLSHFSVHFSPIFYFLLPGYMIFSSPIYLLVVQAIFVGMGVFPVFRIAKKLGLSPLLSTGCSLIYAFFPSMASGCFYDFHENKFLAVILLYLVYFILEEKTVPAFIFAVLTLMVKEDAAIYVMAVALYVLFSRKEKLKGAVLLALSVAYFFFAIRMIEFFGGEIMLGRFSNFYPFGEEGFLAVIKVCVLNIGYLFSQVFTAEKFQYILWIMTPLLFVPFIQKKQSNFFLLMPILVINLMSNWPYQFNIDFQYTYGSTALLIFAFILSVSELNNKMKRFAVLTSVVISFSFCGSLTVGKFLWYSDDYRVNKDVYAEVSDALAQFKEDDSITASRFLIPHLWYVDDLRHYKEYYDKDAPKTEYWLLDIRDIDENDKLAEKMGDDYELVETAGFMEVYRLRNKSVSE